MINLPFDKWTLKIHSSNYEKLYEEHQNEIRMMSFQLVNILVTIATFVCLIILLIEKQSNMLIIILSLNIATNFSMFLLHKKLQPYMKQIFSSLFIFSTASQMLLDFSDIEIPHYVLGFSAGSIAVCLIQHSDNRLKIIFLIATPTALLVVFDVFKIATLGFVVYAYACMILVGTLAYKNEYTSRMAFSLMLLSKKQKDIINEYVQDALLAVSFNERTSQFNLEFRNAKCEEQFSINDTEQLKVFLRSSFLITKQSMNFKTSQDSKKSLEEILFFKIKEIDNVLWASDFFPEISYQQSNVAKILSLQIKTADFGKTLMLITIKSNIPNNQGEVKKHYQQIILNQSKYFSEYQVKLYNQIKKIQSNFIDKRHVSLLQCLNLQIINMVRNYIIYFNKDKIYNQIDHLERCNFKQYVQTLEEYFYIMADHLKFRLEILNYTDQELKINLNTKFLTQILVNSFNQIIKKASKHGMISLQVTEESNLNPQRVKNTGTRFESSQKVDLSQHGMNLKLITFCFRYESKKENFQDINRSSNYDPINMADIEQHVTNMLLDILGPYNNDSQIAPTDIQQQGQIVSKIQFHIYSDQSLLEQSYTKFVQQKQSLIQ